MKETKKELTTLLKKLYITIKKADYIRSAQLYNIIRTPMCEIMTLYIPYTVVQLNELQLQKIRWVPTSNY